MHHHSKLLAAFYSPEGTLLKSPTITNDAVFKIAEPAVDGFNENQLIYDEFNFYQEHKSVLGVHPVFRVYKLKLQITKMRESSAEKRLSLMKNYINRDTKKQKTLKDPEAIKKFSNKVELWKEERDLLISIHNLE